MSTRESKYVKVARIAYRLCKEVAPAYSHLKSPHRYTQPQLFACVLLMFYVRKSYRDMEEWLLASEAVVQELRLKEVPDHSTLNRTYTRMSLKLLERLQRRLLDDLGPQEQGIAQDTTGFSPSQASMHYLARCGRKYDHFYKGGYAVGVESQLILASKSGQGPGADTPFLEPLRRKAARYGQSGWMVLADSGFDAQTVQPGDLIPPIRRGGVLKDPERIERMELVLAAKLDGWYGQRWKVETVNSVIKRKFGDEIRSHKPSRRYREPIVKGLIYNIHV
jgi:Transposase DDE domain